MRYFALLIAIISCLPLTAGKLSRLFGSRKSKDSATIAMPQASITCYNNTDRTLYVTYFYISVPTITLEHAPGAYTSERANMYQITKLPNQHEHASQRREVCIPPHGHRILANGHTSIGKQERYICLWHEIHDESREPFDHDLGRLIVETAYPLYRSQISCNEHGLVLKAQPNIGAEARGNHTMSINQSETDAQHLYVTYNIDTSVHTMCQAFLPDQSRSFRDRYNVDF